MTTTETQIDYKTREHQWAEALREPQRIQATGVLGMVDSDGNICEQCCLDVVCELAGLPWSTRSFGTGGLQVRRESKDHVDESISDLPKQAQVWIGVNTADPIIDFTEGLVTQGCDEENCRLAHDDEFCDGGDNIRNAMNAVNLNDEWNFTFAQIADLVDYFGLVRP